MDAQDNTKLVERNEKVAIQLNPLCVAQNLNHDMDNDKISEVQSLVLAPPKSLKFIENKSNLSLQNKMASNYDSTYGSNGINHTRNLCTDLIISHVHPCAEILQADNQSSIIHDHFYGFIWFIYMMICIHMCCTMHYVSMLIHLGDGCTFLNPLVNSSKPSKINNEDKNSEIQTLVHVESLNLKYMKNKSNLIVQRILCTCDITVSAIKHDQNICADLTRTHVDTSADFLIDESLCALNDPCNISYNKNNTLSSQLLVLICLQGYLLLNVCVILCLICLSILSKCLRKFLT